MGMRKTGQRARRYSRLGEISNTKLFPMHDRVVQIVGPCKHAVDRFYSCHFRLRYLFYFYFFRKAFVTANYFFFPEIFLLVGRH